MQEHQADDGQVTSISKTGPEARYFIGRKGNDVGLGLPHSESAEFEPGPQCPALSPSMLPGESLIAADVP